MTLADLFVAIFFSVLLFISGCSSVSSEVQAGRNALQTGRANDAVGYLTQAAAADPNYKIPYRVQVSVLAFSVGLILKPAKLQRLAKRWKERLS